MAVAPNGARKNRDDHPNLPITIKEIVRTAAECREAGACMLHLHIRDTNGKHTLDPEIYKSAIDTIQKETAHDLLIQVTSEAVSMYSPAEQMAAIRAVKPEAVSLALREFIPQPTQEKTAAEFFNWLHRENVIAQYILFTPEELSWYASLQARGIIPPKQHPLLFVLGRYATNQQSQPTELIPFVNQTNSSSPWMVCAFGASESACAMTAAALGGHARVGFENNLLLSNGRVADNNAQLVDQVRHGAEVIGRPLANADEAREIFAC